MFGARDQVQHVIDAIYAMQWLAICREDVLISPGEALARLADHFVEVWKPLVRRPTRAQRRLIEQKDGLCAVPGCSRSAEHGHHIVFRSRGGGDEPENLLPLCAVHHLRAVHRGWLHISGRNGGRLLVQLAAVGEGGVLEAWVLEGDGLPVRAPAEAGARPSAGAHARELAWELEASGADEAGQLGWERAGSGAGEAEELGWERAGSGAGEAEELGWALEEAAA